MEGQSRSSHRYLLLQVWCGLLTVSVVVMAVFLASIKSKSDEVSTLKLDISPTGNFDGNFLLDIPIQVTSSGKDQYWEESPGCDSCSLVLRNDSIYCKKKSWYFIYAQVTFRKTHQSKSVVLKRNEVFGKSMKKLAEGTCPLEEGFVWVARIVSLTEGDSVSLEISGDILKDSTVWGAFQLC
uniref:THD domain-containing protein n=1 Tax=Amphiprion percula TaxID=161767 RepID=A0A3P8U849_AMPPE